MAVSVISTLSIVWNLRTRPSAILDMNWGVCVEQIHLAKMVQQKDGTLGNLRSRNQYNVFYRTFEEELNILCISANRSQLALFLNSADFDPYIIGKWSALLNFTFNKSFDQDQYRLLLEALRDMYLGRSSPGNMKLALQKMLRLDANLIDVLEFFKDSAKIAFFTNNWIIRDDAVLIVAGTTTTASGVDTLIDITNLAAFADGDLIGFQVVITGGVAVGEIKNIIANVSATGTVTVDSAWGSAPGLGDPYTITHIRSERDDLSSLRPLLSYYTAFGLTNYGFQVWVSVDDYLNVVGFIVEVVKRIRPAHTVFAIAYIFHQDVAGSLIAALSSPTTNPVFVAVGTGNPAWDPFDPQPTGGETALYAETARTLALINFIDADENPVLIPTRRLEISGFFEPGVATSTRVMEVGLFAEDGVTLIDYRAFSAIDKRAQDAFIMKFRQKYDSL